MRINFLEISTELIYQSFPDHSIGFSDHSCISHVKQNSPIQRFTCGTKICFNDSKWMSQLLKVIDTKRIVGFDMIPPKLVKVDVHVLCNSLTKASCKVFSNIMLKLLYFLHFIALLLKRVIFRPVRISKKVSRGRYR